MSQTVNEGKERGHRRNKRTGTKPKLRTEKKKSRIGRKVPFQCGKKEEPNASYVTQRENCADPEPATIYSY
jgi:hypothetical protein